MSIILHFYFTFSFLFCKLHDTCGLFYLLSKVNSINLTKLCSSFSLWAWSITYSSQQVTLEVLATDLMVREFHQNHCNAGSGCPTRTPTLLSVLGRWLITNAAITCFFQLQYAVSKKKCNIGLIFKSEAVLQKKSLEINIFLFFPLKYILHNIAASISRTQW